ncbi:MAG: protoporphyrinogen oxidase [Pseudomonadota bacterium]
MRIKELLSWATDSLKDACERPAFEAELLLAYHLQKERIYLMTHENEAVPDREGFEALVARRASHEPYEYIVGSASFYDIHLKVAAGVLIPRPETELLIDVTANIIKEEGLTHIAEIGVGTGAISIVLARQFPKLHSIATDISDMPLKVAAENIETFGLQERIELRKSNLLDEVPEVPQLVVSNPPYIAEDFLLASNVVDYEPKEALFGGKVGDELLKQIIVDTKAKGVPYLACEMGYDQKNAMQAFVNEIGVEYIQFYTDLAGLDRGFVIKFHKGLEDE